MFGKIVLMGAASLLALTGYATTSGNSEGEASAVGTLYHYVRSNHDGSDAEHIYVYRQAENHLEVYTMRERCTDADFASAWVDPKSGQASMITSGRLMPHARQEQFSTVSFDGTNRRLSVQATGEGGNVSEQILVDDAPWHLYDFDLASLSVQTMALADPRAGFEFGLPLIYTAAPPGEHLTDLGTAVATFEREELYAGQTALRFDVSGDGLADQGGPLWIDAQDGHVLGAEWGLPNHAGMEDFALRLESTQKSSETAWTDLLASHFDGCATA